ncbi:MAG: hypothetical protein ABJJ01_07555, partial [Marinomonas sp.]
MGGPDAAGKSLRQIEGKEGDGDKMRGLIGEVGPKPLTVLRRHGVGFDRVNRDMSEGEKSGG